MLSYRARRSSGLIGGTLAVLFLRWWFSGGMVDMPAAVPQGTVALPYSEFLTIVIAALVAGSLDGPLRTFESMASKRFFYLQCRRLVATSGIVILAIFTTAAVTQPASSALDSAKAFVIWLGLALLSGRLMGMSLSWVIPSLSIFPLTFLGYETSETPFWWNWATPGQTDPLTWILVVVALVIGAASYHLTPWRIASIRRRLRLRRENPASLCTGSPRQTT
ncbi:hypothetical protein ACIBO2_20565 [Nonomuraea sp. NPDC050022]|uniref:hypothetical protein n=1 Tax=Nonomuraea sp. NPDC050022 TaxID=3364358 RepID=UPI0037B1B4FD